MDDKTKRQKRSPDELVSQYRGIGIPAVAAAARYQSRERPDTGSRRQEEKSQQQDSTAGNDNDKKAKAGHRFVEET
jgi:hypothetical protein